MTCPEQADFQIWEFIKFVSFKDLRVIDPCQLWEAAVAGRVRIAASWTRDPTAAGRWGVEESELSLPYCDHELIPVS